MKVRIILRQVVFLLLFLLAPFTLSAQKKEISQAKQWLKAGNNLENAEQSMQKLLKDSSNWENEKIWSLLFNAVKKQYEQGNEKLYLKQQYDTASLFTLNKKMFEILERFDSVEARPDKKGRVELKYRKKHADFLVPFRSNLFSGGSYFVNKRNYPEAYVMFSTYLDCGMQPLFTGIDFMKKDSLKIYEAAYWAVFCGYKMKKPKDVFRYMDLALKDTLHRPYTLQYQAEAFLMQNDTVKWLSILEKGFRSYPRFVYFFPHLADYYSHHGQMAKALDLSEKALQVDPTNLIYQYAKANILLNMGSYKDCISLCDHIISKNSSMADAYLTAGLAFFNQAVELDKNIHLTANQKSQIQTLYHRALPYLDHYRKMAPNSKDKWSLPLYTIYLNLNMGKEFDEMNAIINNEQKK